MIKFLFTVFWGVCFLTSIAYHPVSAQVLTWNGAVSQQWNQATNWSPALVPTSSSMVVIGACSVCPNLTANVSIKSIVVTSGARLSLANWLLTAIDSASFHSATLYSSSGTIIAPKVLFESNTINGSLYIRYTGNESLSLAGGNTFQGDITIESVGTGLLRLASSLADTYNGNASFTQSGTGKIQPACSGENVFKGNIYAYSSSSPVAFGSSTAANVVLSGTTTQLIQANQAILFKNLRIAKSAGEVLIKCPITITGTLELNKGNIELDQALGKPLFFGQYATVSGGNASSYVHGSIARKGNKRFTFPFGRAGLYRPIALGDIYADAMTKADTSFVMTASYIPEKQSASIKRKDNRLSLNGCEYWSVLSSSTSQFSVAILPNTACQYPVATYSCIARCLVNGWQKETTLFSDSTWLSTNRITFENVPTVLTLGHWKQLTVNTTQLSTGNVSIIGAGVSSPMLFSGTAQSIISLFPVFSPNPSKDTLLIEFTTNEVKRKIGLELDSSQSAVPKLSFVSPTGWKPLLANYYQWANDLYQGQVLTLLASEVPTYFQSVRLNLEAGLVLPKRLEVSGLVNLKAKLIVKGIDNTEYVSEKRLYKGDIISWEPTAQVLNNIGQVSSFTLVLEDKGQVIYTYKGQFIKK